MQYKLVVLDMDGTLLDGENTISEVNRDAISRLKDQGVQFVLASGRPHESLMRYAEELAIDAPIISVNGGLVKTKSTAEVLSSSTVPMHFVHEILEKVASTSFAVSLYMEGSILTFADEMLELHKDLEGVEAKKIESLDENLPIIKILLTGHHDEVSVMHKQFGKEYEDELYVTSSEPYFLEVLNKDASKGIALEKLIRKWDIATEEVIAMGNNFNDVAMFEVAGFSVAMANSPLEVQQQADFVSKSNLEDGVAFALEKLFKGRY